MKFYRQWVEFSFALKNRCPHATGSGQASDDDIEGKDAIREEVFEQSKFGIALSCLIASRKHSSFLLFVVCMSI